MRFLLFDFILVDLHIFRGEYLEFLDKATF